MLPSNSNPHSLPSKLNRGESPYHLSPAEYSIVQAKHKIFQDFLVDFSLESGEEISLQERENISGDSDISLTYGEIDFVSIAEIYYTIVNRYGGLPNGTFYDLGSGVGKCIIATAFLCNFQKCVGIEILEGLYEMSRQVKEKYCKEFRKIRDENEGIFEEVSEIEFYKGSFFDYDWRDADLVFANSTCFGNDIMEKIGAVELKVGTLGISFTEVFIGRGWVVLESVKKNMSWGQATVYIQRYIGID
jgi:hypothetical protein